MAQQKCGAMTWVKGGQFVEYGFLKGLVIQGGFNGVVIVVTGRKQIYVGGVDDDLANLLTAVFVFAHVVCHGENPTGKAVFCTKPVGIFDDFEEEVLQKILGFFPIAAQHAIKIIQQAFAVALI